MQAYIRALLGWRKLLSVCFAGLLLALGSAHADSGKGVPAKLTPLPAAPVQAPPVPTPVVLQAPLAPPTCVWRKEVISSFAQGPGFVLSALAVEACGTTIWSPGVSYHYAGQTLQSVSFIEVCE